MILSHILPVFYDLFTDLYPTTSYKPTVYYNDTDREIQNTTKSTYHQEAPLMYLDICTFILHRIHITLIDFICINTQP